METKTGSLVEDAYDRLEAEKREGGSFSDVVRRLTTSGVDLEEFHGALSAETADGLEAAIAARRTRHGEERAERRERVVDALDE